MAAPFAGVIDTDVHHYFRDGVRDLRPYLDPGWRKKLGLEKTGLGSSGNVAGLDFRIPTLHYLVPGGTLREDSAPSTGGVPGSDPSFMVHEVLDRWGFDAAILRGGAVLGLGGIPDPDLGAALAAAHNDWTDEFWLRRDPRLKSSIVIGPRDAQAAVREIERWSKHLGMVDVYIPDTDGLTLGKRHFWPIYEAAEHFGLPISAHPGGACAGANGPMMAATPTYFAEYTALLPTIAEAHVTSLIFEGVFERFPKLKAAIIEGGFAWMPHLMWRLDKTWKAMRQEVPWVKRLPSEYIVDHIRCSTQPMAEPPEWNQMIDLMGMMHADQVLMFSTDYPHWDGDVPDWVAPRLPEAWREHIMRGNAASMYSRLQRQAPALGAPSSSVQ
jgi:predicted TIM-barrel fold metal-dependent hydrolase